jgi:NAD(P)-dependent dehydrogenase (short-subunit alcohol dehydrogenase family)
MSGFGGRVAVVTGGASGIGEATARLLASRHARVVVADLDETQADVVADQIGGTSVTFDVTDPEATERAAAHVEAAVGRVEVLVTSAGIAQRPTAPEQFDIADWEAVLSVDLRGTWLSAKAFGSRMARRGGGSVVTIASVTALRSTPLHAYGPAKAAVAHLTANLAAEWGRSGVRVNCVAPGYTLTPLLQKMIDAGERDPATMARTAAMGRLVDADEVARAIAFLASEEAAAITGVTLPVDAGWTVAPSWATYGGVPATRTEADR